jgi:hypothetical protein
MNRLGVVEIHITRKDKLREDEQRCRDDRAINKHLERKLARKLKEMQWKQ